MLGTSRCFLKARNVTTKYQVFDDDAGQLHLKTAGFGTEKYKAVVNVFRYLGMKAIMFSEDETLSSVYPKEKGSRRTFGTVLNMCMGIEKTGLRKNRQKLPEQQKTNARVPSTSFMLTMQCRGATPSLLTAQAGRDASKGRRMARGRSREQTHPSKLTAHMFRAATL